MSGITDPPTSSNPVDILAWQLDVFLSHPLLTAVALYLGIGAMIWVRAWEPWRQLPLRTIVLWPIGIFRIIPAIARLQKRGELLEDEMESDDP